jgi:hypothetical protein
MAPQTSFTREGMRVCMGADTEGTRAGVGHNMQSLTCDIAATIVSAFSFHMRRVLHG